MKISLSRFVFFTIFALFASCRKDSGSASELHLSDDKLVKEESAISITDWNYDGNGRLIFRMNWRTGCDSAVDILEYNGSQLLKMVSTGIQNDRTRYYSYPSADSIVINSWGQFPDLDQRILIFEGSRLKRYVVQGGGEGWISPDARFDYIYDARQNIARRDDYWYEGLPVGEWQWKGWVTYKYDDKPNLLFGLDRLEMPYHPRIINAINNNPVLIEYFDANGVPVRREETTYEYDRAGRVTNRIRTMIESGVVTFRDTTSYSYE
jgi:YD repeat-containing protein